jgi:two-component system response regulator FixJ
MEAAAHAIAVIDDDAAVRRSLGVLLESAGFEVQTFESGDHFLDEGGAGMRCVVADLRMPGVSGLELLRKCGADERSVPFIFLTAHGDIQIAVEAMKMGASDFLEKPCEPQRMIDAITRAIARPKGRPVDDAARAEVEQRVATLSVREHDVLRTLLVRGHNKSVATELGISVRTVEIHRSRILAKMGVDSLTDLVRVMLSAGVTP